MRLASLLSKKFSLSATHLDDSSNQSMRRQWDALRRSAVTPSERAEIDAIFSRSMP